MSSRTKDGNSPSSQNEAACNQALTFLTEELRERTVYRFEKRQKKDGTTYKRHFSHDQWIQKVFFDHQITLNENRQFVVGIFGNRVFEKSDFIKYLQILEYYGRASGTKAITKENLQLLVDEIVNVFNRQQKLTAIQKISFKAEQQFFGLGELDRMLLASVGAVDPLDKAAVLHWIWQVKRKLAGLPVDHHLMLIFYGEQGGGKSRLIACFLSPVKGMYFATNFLQIIDDRLFKVIRDYPVIFTDEMAGAEKTCINQIKNRISSDTVSGRTMFSNDTEVVANNATWIGGTNFPLEEIFKDDTGNRRFYQLSCLPRGQWDRDAINEIDYFSIWQSVDENLPSPLIQADLVSAMHDRQQDRWRYKTLVEEFLEEKDLVPKESDKDLFFISVEELRTQFAWWLKSMGKLYAMPANTVLGRQFKKNRLIECRKSINGRQVRGYYIRWDLKSGCDDAFKRETGVGLDKTF